MIRALRNLWASRPKRVLTATVWLRSPGREGQVYQYRVADLSFEEVTSALAAAAVAKTKVRVFADDTLKVTYHTRRQY